MTLGSWTRSDDPANGLGRLKVDLKGVRSLDYEIRAIEWNNVVSAILELQSAYVGGTASLVVRLNSGGNIGSRPRLNFIEGVGIDLTVTDDAGDNEIDVVVALAGAALSRQAAYDAGELVNNSDARGPAENTDSALTSASNAVPLWRLAGTALATATEAPLLIEAQGTARVAGLRIRPAIIAESGKNRGGALRIEPAGTISGYVDIGITDQDPNGDIAAPPAGSILLGRDGRIYGKVGDSPSDVWRSATRDRAGHTYVVGHSGEGDTLDDCDYLDTGNGEAIEDALAAAGALTPPGSVHIRRGTYDLDSGGTPEVTAPFDIPQWVKVTGDGIGSTIIQSRKRNDQGVFVLQSNASLGYMTIEVKRPAAATSGSTSVIGQKAGHVGPNWVDDIYMAFEAGLTDAETDNLTLQAGFGNGIASATRLRNLLVVGGWKIRQFDANKTFRGIAWGGGVGTSAGISSTLEGCWVQGCDIGFGCGRGDMALFGCSAYEPALSAFEIESKSKGIHFFGCTATVAADSAVGFRAAIADGTVSTELTGIAIVGCRVVRTGGSNTLGVYFNGGLSGGGDGRIRYFQISGCHFEGLSRGIKLDGGTGSGAIDGVKDGSIEGNTFVDVGDGSMVQAIEMVNDVDRIAVGHNTTTNTLATETSYNWSPSPSAPVATLGLYTLDGVKTDSSGNGRTAVSWYGGAADHFVQGARPKKRAWRALVPAYGDGLQLTSGNSGWAQLTGAMSVVVRACTIVDVRATVDQTNRVIVECGGTDAAGGANNTAWRLMFGYSSSLIVEWYTGAGPTQTRFETSEHCPSARHNVLAFTRSSGGVVKVYRDAELIGTSGALTLPTGVTNAKLVIGASAHSGYAYCGADISDVAIYGSELTAAQIREVTRRMLGEHGYLESY